MWWEIQNTQRVFNFLAKSFDVKTPKSSQPPPLILHPACLNWSCKFPYFINVYVIVNSKDQIQVTKYQIQEFDQMCHSGLSIGSSRVQLKRLKCSWQSTFLGLKDTHRYQVAFTFTSLLALPLTEAICRLKNNNGHYLMSCNDYDTNTQNSENLKELKIKVPSINLYRNCWTCTWLGTYV